jgi:hypothetical protein
VRARDNGERGRPIRIHDAAKAAQPPRRRRLAAARFRWVRSARALFALCAGGLLPAATNVRAEPAVSTRPVLVQWAGQLPRLSFAADDFVTASVAEKLGSGLPQRIVTRVYAYPEGGEQPITMTVLSCRVVYDLWEGVYRVQEQTANADRSRTVPDLKGVVQTCLNVRVMALGDQTTFARHRNGRVYFGAIVELNPLSPDTVQRIRRWLSKSGGGQLRGDAFFGSFVSIFVSRRMGSAEHTLAFRSSTFSVP